MANPHKTLSVETLQITTSVLAITAMLALTGFGPKRARQFKVPIYSDMPPKHKVRLEFIADTIWMTFGDVSCIWQLLPLAEWKPKSFSSPVFLAYLMGPLSVFSTDKTYPELFSSLAKSCKSTYIEKFKYEIILFLYLLGNMLRKVTFDYLNKQEGIKPNELSYWIEIVLAGSTILGSGVMGLILRHCLHRDRCCIRPSGTLLPGHIQQSSADTRNQDRPNISCWLLSMLPLLFTLASYYLTKFFVQKSSPFSFYSSALSVLISSLFVPIKLHLESFPEEQRGHWPPLLQAWAKALIKQSSRLSTLSVCVLEQLAAVCATAGNGVPKQSFREIMGLSFENCDINILTIFLRQFITPVIACFIYFCYLRLFCQSKSVLKTHGGNTPLLIQRNLESGEVEQNAAAPASQPSGTPPLTFTIMPLLINATIVPRPDTAETPRSQPPETPPKETNVMPLDTATKTRTPPFETGCTGPINPPAAASRVPPESKDLAEKSIPYYAKVTLLPQLNAATTVRINVVNDEHTPLCQG